MLVVVFTNKPYANSNIKVAINPGHGYIHLGGFDGWAWQRKEFQGVREDLITPEFAIILNGLLTDEEFSTIPLRD